MVSLACRTLATASAEGSSSVTVRRSATGRKRKVADTDWTATTSGAARPTSFLLSIILQCPNANSHLRRHHVTLPCHVTLRLILSLLCARSNRQGLGIILNQKSDRSEMFPLRYNTLSVFHLPHSRKSTSSGQVRSYKLVLRPKHPRNLARSQSGWCGWQRDESMSLP